MYGQEPNKKPPVKVNLDDNRTVSLDEWDDEVAAHYKVPRSLMRAIASQESGGNVNAKSPTGVVGKYQVTKDTAQSYGLDRDDPWQQSVAAAKHLRKLFDETDGADDDEKWLGAVGKYYGGNNAVRNGELVGSSIDGVSNPAEHVRRVAQKWGEIRRSERGTQPQAQPQQPAPRGTSSADIIPPEQRLTIPEGQSLNIGTGQIGKRAPVQGAAARRPNEAVEGAQRALSFLQPEELAWEAKQITDRAKISPETNRMRPTLGPGVPSPSAITGSPQPLAKQREAIKARGFAPRPMPRKPGMLEAARNILSPQWVETPFLTEGAQELINAGIKRSADFGAGAVRLGERAAEKTLTGGPLSGALDLLPDSMAGPYKDYRKAVQDRVQAFGQSRQATKGAQTIGRAADTLAPISNEPTTYDPRKAEFYSRTLPQAAGSLVPLVGASLMTGGAAAAPFLAGAAMNAEQTYQETMARTGNEQLARQAADTGAAIGALEGFGLGRMLNKFGIKQALAKRALQVVEEAGQEGASQWLNNVNMRLRQIDPNRSLSPLDEEVLGNALLGAIMGGAAQVGGRMISGPEAAQGKILREGGQPVSRDAAAQEPFVPTVRQPSPQETADADIRGVVQNYVAEMSALEQQPRTPERDAQMAQMREDYRALRNYIRDPQSLSDEQLQAILGRQQAAPEVAAEPMAQETVAPGVENAPTAEVAPVEPSAPRPSGYVDVARTAQAEAADAERAGNWEAAVTRYAEQHEALKQYQRELRKTGTPEQKAEIARQISAADLSRRRASREVLRQERMANAPTRGLQRERASTPKAAEVAPTGGLLSSTVNPEGGVPKLPTQEVDFTRLAAEQSAQKPPKPAKRLLSRIAELGGIDERYAGELQDAADARRIGVIRKRAQMSPDIMARQLASEGYDVDPEDLNTLWEAARRDIVQGERPVNTAELTRRSEGTAELERRLTAPEARTSEKKIVQVGDEMVELSPEQAQRWANEIEEGTRLARESYAYKLATGMSKVDADKWLKGKMIQLAAKKREIADRLTDTERGVIARKEASNYQGKPVAINSNGVQTDGVVVGMSFGKVRVKLADGSVVSVSPDNVQARKAAPPTEKPVAYTAAQQAPASSVEAPATATPVQTPEPMTGVESPLDRLKRIAQEANRRFAEPAQETAAELPRQTETPTPATPAKPQSQKQAPASEPKLSNRVVRKSLQEEMGATSTNRSDQLRLSGPSTNYREVVTTWDDAPEGVVFKKPEHYGDQANVLFDRRLEDRTTDKGENASFLMEMQSDWHQSKDAPAAPLKNTWARRAIEDSLAEAQSAGQDGVLLPKTVDQIYEIQRWGRVREENGRYLNHEGFDITPVVRRYAREVPELAKKIARKNGVELQTRTVDDGRGGKQELWYLPVKEKQSPKFTPDTADLREVREFGKREPRTEQFTEEPPTAPLARGRQRITPFRPPSPQQPAGAFPARPSPSPMSRPITPEGRRVQGEIEAGRGKEGEFGKLAQLLFKSTRGDIAHGQDSFFHDKDVKGAVGLTVDAEQGDTRKAIKASVAKMLGVKADEISLTQIKPETWQRWARVKRLGPEANAKLNIAIEKWKQGATNDQETATPQTTERQQPGRASELPATPRGAARQQTPATQESAAIKSGDRVQWEQRGRTETAFVSRIKGDTAYVDYGTGDEVAVPVKRLRKADVSPADAVRQIKPNGGLVPMVQLKRALGADADAAILAAAERGEIALHRHNQPSAMTAEEKASAVHDATQGDRGWYIGASVREGATFRQQEPPLKAQMRTRSDVESSPAFQRWFGESKAVNRYGEPLIVYHGTISETPFEQFDASRIGSAYEGSAGFWFTDTPETAASYADIEPVELSRRGYNLTADPSEQSEMSGDLWQEDFGGGRRILGAYLKLENPKIVNASEFPQGFPDANKYVERIKNTGNHDGVIIRGVGYDSGLNVPVNDHYIVFSPNQIKSATGNKGTFSTESPNISERRGAAPPMPERYTIRQVAQNAQMRFRPAANRPGSLYLNDWGGELMNRLLDDVYGTTTTDTNFTMDVKDARNLLDHLRDMAAVDTLYSQEELANVREAADQFERAIQAAEKGGYDVAVLTRKPNEKLSQTKVKVRHEATHASQSTIASDLAALTGGTWVDSQPKAKQIRDALARRGYAPESHDFEAAAFIASGDESVFGMSVDEGAQFLASYFDEVIKRHGKNALDRFGAIAPRYQPTLERARNEAQIRQTQTQSRAALDIGEPGQTGSTGRSGRGIQAEGRFGTEETPRRPQTGLLRGIDLEKVKQRQAGGGGAMPPRPPRPSREGGEPRKEPSRREPKPDAEASTGSLRARAFETLGSYQTAAQLGTPGFVGRNVLQHLGYAIQSGIADRVAQAIDASIATLTRGPRRVVVPGNPVSNAIEGWRAYREGVRDAWAKTRRGEALDSGQIDELKNAPTNKLARAFRTFLTVINEIPDAGNYAARYQRRMKILTATAKRNGMQITEENLVKLQKQAELEAAHDSMRDANFVSEMLKRTKGAMNKLSEPITGTERFGLGDFILKYTQVPGALIKRGIEYSPLGLIESAFHAGRATMGKGGEYEAKQAIQSLSRAVSGTASTVGMGALLAAAGVLVEPEKEDYTSEELERERGVRGFSVNLSALARLGSSLLGSGEGKTAKQAGDKLVPIDWAQPWAMGASVGATLWNQKKAGKFDKTGAVGAAGKSFENMLEIMGDQSVLKNLRAYVRAMKGDTFGEQMEGAIKKFVKDVPSSFTPGVTRQVGQVIDPNVRDYRTENREGIRNAFAEGMKRAAAGAVPGLSRQFPARVSPMTGEARKTAQGEMGVAGRLLNLLSPVTVNEYKDDPLADAIIRLNEKLDKDKLSLYVRPLGERETKLEGYKEGTTQLRQREGEFARAFARDGRRLVTSSGFKAANESRQAEMLEELISKLRQKTYKEGPIARTLAEAQRAQRLQKAQRPQ